MGDRVNIVLTSDPLQFAAQAGEFLAARAERNVAATVLNSVLAGGYAGSRPLFAYGRDEPDRIRLAALRTAPWPLLVSDLEPALAPALLERWLTEDDDLSGVSGLPDAAQAVASLWRERTGGKTYCHMKMALHCLERVVDPPRPAAGSLRLPTPEERRLLVDWNDAFDREAAVTVSGQSEARVDERLGYGGWLIWDDQGPVSLVGVNLPVAGAVRVGPVYTPPESRNRGYASAAVAAASRHALAQGASRCLLYTDLANPTSNKIYAHVGYVRVADWEQHAFS
jgi:RimJ/RimL family protein N-acetyltransferase